MSKSPEAYAAAFEAERVREYSVMDALESRYGYAIERGLLERMARVLACPVKRNGANWQHGRLVYALARHRLSAGSVGMFFESGSAKGFATACMSWACHDAGFENMTIWSRDIIDPASNEPRNSAFDGQIENGIWDFVAPFLPPDDNRICFTKVDSDYDAYCRRAPSSISFAFIDGSHTYEGVKADIELVVPRQKVGDIILFDDYHLDPVQGAIYDAKLHRMDEPYRIEPVVLKPGRSYAIATRVA